MMKWLTLMIVGVLLAGLRLAAEEPPALSLATAQPLSGGNVTASGRVLPQYSARLGARLSGHIVEWGRDAAGQPLDAGVAVEAGQVLFRVDPSTFAAKVETAQAALRAAEAALADKQAPTRPERVAVLRAALVELAARRQDLARDEQRYRQLVEVDKTVAAKRLEEIVLNLALVESQTQAAQARLDEALAGATKTETAVAAANVKLAQTNLATAELDLRDTTVRAPFAGAVTRRFKALGDYVGGAPFVEVLELTAVASLEVELSLPEIYLPQLTPGKTRVEVRSPLLSAPAELTITRVIPEVDAQRGTVAVRLAVPAAARGQLVPGAFVTGRLLLGGGSEGVVVPQRAIVVAAGKAGVLVPADGKMQRRAVELGDRLTEGVVVKSGLAPNERVLVGPAELLQDGAALPAHLQNAPPAALPQP